MVNYQNGKIYKIIGTTEKDELIYIGSTTELLCRRLSGHKSKSKLLKECVSSIIFTSCLNYDIILIENYPCNNKEELLSRERYWIENINCINKQTPIRFQYEKDEYNKKYSLEHKEEHQAYCKLYLENNKEHLYKQNKIRYDKRNEVPIICICGTSCCKDAIKRHEQSKKHLKYVE